MRSSKIVLGILAHVDAGKTTLSEALLYTAGELRKPGRVDHGDAFLDNFALERERGITIFSKQANLEWRNREIILLDTPGHVDFSAEMERTLQVLDYALLVISGSDGVQAHTATLWKLLQKYRIPTFLFINKMDQPDTDRTKLMEELKNRLDSGCIAFDRAADDSTQWREEVAMCSEALLEEYLESGELSDAAIAAAVRDRRLFPCYFGAALQLDGVEELLDGLCRFAQEKEYPGAFGARVYKISRDAAGNRLTHLKVTGGVLRVKMLLDNHCSAASEEERWEEKADTLRICDGAGFRAAEKVEAGGICAVTGLGRTFAGEGLGEEGRNEQPVLVPVLTYRLVAPEGTDMVKLLGQMRKLEEEEPELNVVWREKAKEIHVQVMGEVQTQILQSLIRERFGLEVSFDDGQLLYKETIASKAVGIGHFEPLRHYAEVQLLLEPGEPGSGLELATTCSEDVLDRNWQRLILSHLEERAHPGVLTGAPLTDVKITLLTGRAHIKHTEGGDFRQATYRALRQGLMQCKSVLLEPVFSFALEVPTEQLGRAMSDIQRMSGSFEPSVTEGEMSILTGSAPVATMREYQREVNAYTRGRGRLSCMLKGYEPCHNEEEIVREIGYDPDADTENPSASVFCSHGAGTIVEWQDVPQYAHLESGWQPDGESGAADAGSYPERAQRKRPGGTGEASSGYITQEEIEAIFQQTYKKTAQSYEPYRYHQLNTGSARKEEVPAEEPQKQWRKNEKEKPEEFFLVDGYNIIFAWDELRALAELNLDSARDRLMDICCNFQGFHGATLILVFDAYKVKGGQRSVQKYHNIYVVYTKEAETADQYIEKTVHEIGKKHRVTVATSDALEQMIIWGDGAVRLSARGFHDAVEAASQRMRETYPGDGKLANSVRIPEGGA